MKIVWGAIVVCLQLISCAPVIRPYPLANQYFQQVYQVRDGSNIQYLTINCKERNALSVSLTQTLTFQEAPRFNIHGDEDPPQMRTDTYTFLSECKYALTLNKNNRLLQIRRVESSALIFALDLNLSLGITTHDVGTPELPTISFKVIDPSTKYGLGQRFQRNFHIKDGKWTIWNRDKPWKIDEGINGISQQTYGHQPIYLAREKEGDQLYHLAYFKNTHGILYESQRESEVITYHARGGNIHFILFLGSKNPQELLERYHTYIGPAHIPPFWAMGFHQCRWGYESLAKLEEVVSKFNINNIPLDTIWSDLDYMDKKMIFTINEKTHPPAKFNDMLKRESIQFVPLIDVGVSVHDQVGMKAGNQMNVFIKDWKNNHVNYIGEVWPGQVHFVDYLHPNSTNFWVSQLERLKKKVNFSGVWLDMNEPSNFRGNEPTYEPFVIQQHEGINQMTIPVQLPHYSPEIMYTQQHHPPLLHEQVHAYFGHLSTIPTYKFLSGYGRPFIISRSNSVGSGKFAGHWTGDNVATWDFLRLSISGNFLFQIFGIQMVGADICGFHDNTNEQLCSRWMQLGAFYPFARNHNEDRGIPQQPYAFGPILLNTSRISLVYRYALLKQMYSWMVRKNGTGSFFRPLFFEFYEDQLSTRVDIRETQFLLGHSLMCAPIVEPTRDSRSVYFPGKNEVWYQLRLEEGKYSNKNPVQYSSGTEKTIQNPLPSPPPLFLRSSNILLTSPPAMRSSKIGNSFHLLAAIKTGDSSAKGGILSLKNYNNAEEIDLCIKDGCWLNIQLERTNEGKFLLKWKYQGQRSPFSSIKVLTVTILHGPQILTQSNPIDIETPSGSHALQLTA